MAIADLPIAGVPKAVKGPTCDTCILLASLDDGEAAALRALLADPLWRYSALSQALEAEGHDIPAYSLSRHARGHCLARQKMRGAGA